MKSFPDVVTVDQEYYTEPSAVADLGFSDHHA